MKNSLRVDFKNSSLIMDKTFAKAASKVGSDEYNRLQRARLDYPDFTVMIREIRRNPNKESYRGLTYSYMEYYISTHGNSAAIMKEYQEMRLRAACHSIRYPHIKKWFLETYPEVAQFGVDTEKTDAPKPEPTIAAA